MMIGKKVRQLRQAKEWSLAELAKRCGVALSSLSRIETGRMTGTLESHLKIVRALGVRLTDLYAGLESSGPLLEIRRKGEDGAGRYAGGKGAHLFPLVSGPLQKKMLPALIQLGPKGHTGWGRDSAGTERFLYLLTGRLEAAAESEKFHLRPGDCLYLRTPGSLTLKNPGSEMALALGISSPPSL